MGRTYLRDVVSMSLGQHFRGWGTAIVEEVEPKLLTQAHGDEVFSFENLISPKFEK